MERNIRDVRDIFGTGEIRSYEYSPRSRRRQEAMDDYDPRPPLNNRHYPQPSSNTSAANNKKNSRHRQQVVVECGDDTPKSDSKGKDYNRTLTERDIRHLERHLSMKKTIRKQISRNLQQAFVDDPTMVLQNDQLPKSKSVPAGGGFTLTRAKVSRSEQNVLDLLKDGEPDSGHCSADNPTSSDDDSHEHLERRTASKPRPALAPPCRTEPQNKDEGKFSFWKMFSVKSKGKR